MGAPLAAERGKHVPPPAVGGGGGCGPNCFFCLCVAHSLVGFATATIAAIEIVTGAVAVAVPWAVAIALLA